jgi:hypothetical protein
MRIDSDKSDMSEHFNFWRVVECSDSEHWHSDESEQINRRTVPVRVVPSAMDRLGTLYYPRVYSGVRLVRVVRANNRKGREHDWIS